jgi:hypothetical protein
MLGMFFNIKWLDAAILTIKMLDLIVEALGVFGVL